MRVQFLSSRGGAPMSDDAGDFRRRRASQLAQAVPGGGGGVDDVAPMDDEDIPF